MTNDKCPHCGGYCLSRLQRNFLAPVRSTPCRSCGEKVSVPYWSVFTIAPIVIAVGVVPYYVSDPFFVAFSATILTFLTGLLNDAFVPLIKSNN